MVYWNGVRGAFLRGGLVMEEMLWKDLMSKAFMSLFEIL